MLLNSLLGVTLSLIALVSCSGPSTAENAASGHAVTASALPLPLVQPPAVECVDGGTLVFGSFGTEHQHEQATVHFGAFAEVATGGQAMTAGAIPLPQVQPPAAEFVDGGTLIFGSFGAEGQHEQVTVHFGAF